MWHWQICMEIYHFGHTENWMMQLQNCLKYVLRGKRSTNPIRKKVHCVSAHTYDFQTLKKSFGGESDRFTTVTQCITRKLQKVQKISLCFFSILKFSYKCWVVLYFYSNLFLHYFDNNSTHCTSEGGVCRGRKQSANKTHLSPDHQLEVDHSVFLLAKQACAASFFVATTQNLGLFLWITP